MSRPGIPHDELPDPRRVDVSSLREPVPALVAVPVLPAAGSGSDARRRAATVRAVASVTMSGFVMTPRL